MEPIERVFDQKNLNWHPSAEYNFLFVKGVYNFAFNMLAARGHLFLNEVYDALGMSRTREGVINGWLFDPTESKQLFHVDVDAHGHLLLLFNPDGPIHDKI